MTLVFNHYPVGGGEFTLALALADVASDDGGKIFPSVPTLARKTRQGERTVQYQLRKMEADGWLQLVKMEEAGRYRAREYRINPEWVHRPESTGDFRLKPDMGAKVAPGAEIAPLSNVEGCKDCTHEVPKGVQSAAASGATDDIEGCKAFAPRTIKEPSKNHQGERARARATPLPGFEKPRLRPGRICPPEFEVTADMLAWARRKRPDVDVAGETEKFRDHEFARVKSNWPAAWRNWIRGAIPRAGTAQTQAPAAAVDRRCVHVNQRNERCECDHPHTHQWKGSWWCHTHSPQAREAAEEFNRQVREMGRSELAVSVPPMPQSANVDPGPL